MSKINPEFMKYLQFGTETKPKPKPKPKPKED